MSRPPNLTDPGELKAFVARHGFSPKKSLGQHWLFAASVVRQIVEAATPSGGILEIGPGPGVLTQALAQIAPTIALDLDERSRKALTESAPKAEFVLGDVLATDLGAIMNRLDSPRVVVSNLPYYITAAVVERVVNLTSNDPHLSHAVLMMQREVAERIAAQPGDSRRGSLSVFVQFHFEVSRVCVVPPGAFLPPPKVESVVLKLLTRKSEIDNRLSSIVRAAFKQPRKTLANNLAAAGMGERALIETAITRAGLDSRVRSHLLTELDWVRLSQALR